MAVVDIRSGDFSLRASTAGGLILGFWRDGANGPLPLLREAPDGADALSSSCYPLVPFGNRVRDNRFTFNGRHYALTANTEWDPHYLHGEGWLSQWSLEEHEADRMAMRLRHAGGGTPYVYEAWQSFSLDDGELQMTLSVENQGNEAMPFGLGWHPYFPMTPETTLEAPARKFWTEVEGWLPGEATDIPADLDFSKPSPLPHRWVNNGFEDWSGEAVITWPERATRLSLRAEPLFRHAFLFVSDTAFDPDFERDYFCFEPMSHLADGHNIPDLGGLRILQPGEKLSGSIWLGAQDL
ncbi:aldose 1-epimerase [Martelella sp. FOR1707]